MLCKPGLYKEMISLSIKWDKPGSSKKVPQNPQALQSL